MGPTPARVAARGAARGADDVHDVVDHLGVHEDRVEEPPRAEDRSEVRDLAGRGPLPGGGHAADDLLLVGGLRTKLSGDPFVEGNQPSIQLCID